MNKITYLIILHLLVSCGTSQSVQITDLEKIPIHTVSPRQQVMKEVLHPQAMHLFGSWVIFINSPQGDAPFYAYSKDDLSFQFHAGKFGRGNGEFFYCNPDYWECRDSSILINTNNFYKTEFTFHQDSLRIIKQDIIGEEAMNNLLTVNDSIIIFSNENKAKEYSVYNTVKHQVIHSFSDFPTTRISYEETCNRDNIMQKQCVINRDAQVIAAFYLRIPLIRLYDFNYKIIKEIRLKGISEKSISMIDFYNNEEELYFLLPYATKDRIFVLFINTTESQSYQQENTELQEWDWNGNLVRRYHIQKQIDLFCISGDAKTFYGLKSGEEDYLIFKGALE